MRIALVLKQKESDDVRNPANQAVVFQVENEKVVGVENEEVKADDVNSLSNWALAKKIKTIYIPTFEEWMRNLFLMLGITLKTYDESEDDRLFQTFIL